MYLVLVVPKFVLIPLVLFFKFFLQTLPDWAVLDQVLFWIVGGGAIVVVMAAVSWLVENWAKWATLPRWIKFIVPIVVSVLIAIGAQEALKFGEIIDIVQPYWAMVVNIILAWLASQAAYMVAKSRQYGARS